MENEQPLKGLTVVTIEQAVAAPLCTARLADAGARVIKIERAEGETARHYDNTVHGTSAYFAWLNRGKESTVFDLKDANDIAFVKLLLSRADVFAQNLAPGAVDRLGLGSAEMRDANPKLITLGISGYGSDTDVASKRAYDLLIQAESGLCSVTGTPETACKIGVSAADIATGMNAHAAILEALIARSVTGVGKEINIAMFDCLADWMNVPLLHLEQAARETQRFGLSHASIYPYRPFACRDGDVVVVVQNPAEWARLCLIVLRRTDLETDPRFITNKLRIENRSALDEEMNPIFADLSREEAVGRLNRANLASAKVCTVEDLSIHEGLRRVEAEFAGEHFTLAAPPLHPDMSRASIPRLGEHTQSIRDEFG